MKQILSSLASVALVLLVVVLGFIVYGSYKENREQIKAAELAEMTPPPIQEPISTPEPEEIDEPENFVDVTLAVAGDIVMHTGLNAEAEKSDGSYDFANIFSGIYDYTSNADYALCTMETTFPETVEYTGYPMFKSPPELATTLKSLGFDLINTANNHSVDGLKAGIFRTIDVLEANGLDKVGTYRSQEERDETNGVVVKDINGVSFAFLSFTYGTNAMPVTGFEYAVNIFYNDYLDYLSDINYDLLREDMAAARALNTDVILVQMHWGIEYETSPRPYQIELADFLFAEGADIIIGGHPHVPEPMELRQIVDNEGNEKVGFLVYSLGNLVSCMNDRYTDLTAVLNIQVQKNLDTGETRLRNISYAPMKMMDLHDYGIEASYRYMLWNLHSAIDGYEQGSNLGVINDTVYSDMLQALTDIREIFGEEFDIKNGGVDAAEWALLNS